MQPTDLMTYLEALSKASAVAAPFVVAGWQAAKKLHPRTTGRVVDLFVRLDRTMTTVEQQLSPNGGGSMHDKVAQMSGALDEIRRDTATLAARQVALITSREEPTFETCEDGDFTIVSRSLEEFTGMSREQLEDMRWLSAFHPNDQERLADRYKAAIRDERKFEYTARLLHRGSVRWVHIHANRMPDLKHRDRTVGWLGVMNFATSEQIAAACAEER